jgi:hypothetical protein
LTGLLGDYFCGGRQRRWTQAGTRSGPSHSRFFLCSAHPVSKIPRVVSPPLSWACFCAWRFNSLGGFFLFGTVSAAQGQLSDQPSQLPLNLPKLPKGNRRLGTFLPGLRSTHVSILMFALSATSKSKKRIGVNLQTDGAEIKKSPKEVPAQAKRSSRCCSLLWLVRNGHLTLGLCRSHEQDQQEHRDQVQ